MANYEQSLSPPNMDAALPRPIAVMCGAGTCPTVYRTSRGTLIIQGAAITAAGTGIDLAAGEALIEIPEELLTQFVAGPPQSAADDRL